MGIFFNEEKSCFNCRHYSVLFGDCSNRRGEVLKTNICPKYESAREYKEQLKKEREVKETRERLERENNNLRQENERLKTESLFKPTETNTTSIHDSPSFAGGFESFELSYDDEIDESLPIKERIKKLDKQLKQLEELEDDLVDFYAPAVKETEKNYISVIKQIKGLRTDSFDNNVISIDGLDEFMLTIPDIKEQLGEPENDESKMDKLIIGFNKKTDVFAKQFQEEIDWNYSHERFNVAYALAESFEKSELISKTKVQKYRSKYISFSIEKAKAFSKEDKYEEAIKFLRPIENEKEASSLLAKYDDEKENKTINDALALCGNKKYSEAIQILKTCNSERAKQLIRKINSNSKKRKMTIVGMTLLVVGIGFMVLGIVSVAKVSAAMSQDVPFDEFCKIQDMYSPLEMIGFLFGIPSLIAGLILSIVGLAKHKIK